VTRHSISARLALCLVLLLLGAGVAGAQPWRLSSGPPDPATYGVHLEMGDLPQVRAWLDAGLDPDFMADRIGTGLMFSAWFGDLPMMELLLARGAAIDKTNALGESALMHAAWRGKLEAVKWLLARGARVNSEPMRWSALHYAVFAGHWEIANQLLLGGADINARSTNGSSVLMMAVYEGHEPLVRRLLARGADPASELAGKIDELDRLRDTLAARGMTDAVNRIDTRIATLRAQRVRVEREHTPAAVLEISASRAAPEDQKMRLIFGTDGAAP